jgi:hypothetical protein
MVLSVGRLISRVPQKGGFAKDSELTAAMPGAWIIPVARKKRIKSLRIFP